MLSGEPDVVFSLHSYPETEPAPVSVIGLAEHTLVVGPEGVIVTGMGVVGVKVTGVRLVLVCPVLQYALT